MKKVEKVFIPEDNFTDVPESFSAESRITRVEFIENTKGIIFDSLEEVEDALRIYNGEKEEGVLSSRTTSRELLEDAHKAGGSLGVGITLLAGIINTKGKDFVGDMMAEVKSEIVARGKFRCDYEYEATGTNFLKTLVEIQKVEDKFLLTLRAAGIGYEAGNNLAALLGRRFGFLGVRIEASISPVDDWWYNLNAKKLLDGILDFDDGGWELFVEKLANSDSVRMVRKYDGEKIELAFEVENSYVWVKTEEGGRDSKSLTKAIGCNVAGAAWNFWRDKRVENPQCEEKKFFLRVKFHSENFNPPPIIDPRKIEFLVAVAKKIEEKLLEKVS